MNGAGSSEASQMRTGLVSVANWLDRVRERSELALGEVSACELNQLTKDERLANADEHRSYRLQRSLSGATRRMHSQVNDSERIRPD